MPDEASENRVYFITFTTYGSRLHGDARGSVDEWHNRFGEPPMEPRPGLEAFERGLLKSPPMVLTAAMRTAVEDAIRERCRFMSWEVLAMNVRTNHAHVLVVAAGAPEKVLNSFKARSTSEMRRRALVGPDARIWARHGSTRRLTTQRDIDTVALYIAEAQGPDLPRE